MIVITAMTILAPKMILNLRKDYYTHVPDISTITAGPELTWNAEVPASTAADTTQEQRVGVWSVEMGGYVTGRRVISELV